MKELTIKKVSLKRTELFILLSLGLLLTIFLKFVLGILGLVQISFFALIGTLLLFISTIKWKACLYFFFFWLLLEGIFRRWIVPPYLSTPIFFVKHLILLGPYFYFFTKRVKVSKKDYPFLGFLLFYLIWGIFEALNFRVTTDFRVQILGLITHFWFVPLIFLIPVILDTEEKILKFFRLIAYVSLPIFILGVIQHFSPSSSLINQYAPSKIGGDMPISAVGEFVRITGVFSYISPYTTYLGFVLMVFLYLLVIRRLSKFRMLIVCIALLLGITNLIMTGSRAPVAVFLIQGLLFLFFSFRGIFKVRKRIFIRFALVTPIILLAMFYTDVGKKSLSAFVERAQTSGDTQSRAIGIYTSFFRFLPDANLVGYGIGTAYQGANNLVEDWKDMPRDFETEWERIVLELGLVGSIIVLFLRLYLLFYSWRVFKKIKSHELKLIALMIFLCQIPILFGENIVFNYLQNIIYWFLLGLLVSVNRLERNNATKSFGISSR